MFVLTVLCRVSVNVPVKCVVQSVLICLSVLYRVSVYICVKCVVQNVHICFC